MGLRLVFDGVYYVLWLLIVTPLYSPYYTIGLSLLLVPISSALLFFVYVGGRFQFPVLRIKWIRMSLLITFGWLATSQLLGLCLAVLTYFQLRDRVKMNCGVTIGMTLTEARKAIADQCDSKAEERAYPHSYYYEGRVSGLVRLGPQGGAFHLEFKTNANDEVVKIHSYCLHDIGPSNWSDNSVPMVIPLPNNKSYFIGSSGSE